MSKRLSIAGNAVVWLFSALLSAHADWVGTIQADNPAYWYRFETTSAAAGVPNAGSTAGFDGSFGPAIAGSHLGLPSATTNLGNAMEFTGPAASAATGKYVDFGAAIPELVALRPPATGQTTSVEFWVKTAHRGSYGGNPWASPVLLGHESPFDGDIYWGWLDAYGDFGFSTSDQDELLDLRNGDGSVQVADGQWHHVILVKTWDPAGPSRSTMIVDGGPQADGFFTTYPTVGGNASYQDSDGQIRYLGFNEGTAIWVNNAQFIGMIDELAIYTTALTADDARRHYFAAFPDSDNDDMSDRYEELHPGLVVGVNDGGGNLDGDSLTNLQEFNRGTDPNVSDTDGDGLLDHVETGTGVWVSATNTGTDPLNPDSDDDGFTDGEESNTGLLRGMHDPGTNPNLADTDGDGFDDYDEADYGSDPTSAAVTQLLAPVYSGPPGVWTWELNNMQVVWDHGSAVRDESVWGDRWLFGAYVANASALLRPSVQMGARLSDGRLTYVFGTSPLSILLLPVWYSDWAIPPAVDQTAALGFSGKGRNDVSDRLRFRVIASEGPGGQSDWTLAYELYNLDTATLIASYSQQGAAVNSIHQGTAQWDWYGDPGQIQLSGHQGVKIWITDDPLGRHDTDDDSMDDSWELTWFTNLNQSALTDWDNDEVLDCDEFLAGTNPKLGDTDNDGASDRYELDQGSDPTLAASLPAYFQTPPPGVGEDLNNNGMSDVWEMWSGSFSLVPSEDSDGDGISNLKESIAGTNPFDDTDYLAGRLSLAAPIVTLSWPAAAYKGYAVWGSLDLVGWLNLTGPVPIRYTVPTDAAIPLGVENEQAYFHLTVRDADTDGDGVTDWSESLLGSVVEDPDTAASRDSIRQAVTTSSGDILHGDYVAMVERIQAANTPGQPAVTAVQASRFLTQATFGPTIDDIAHLQQIGFDAWITEQLDVPASSFEKYCIDMWNDYNGPRRDPYYNRPEDGSNFLFANNITSPFLRAATQGEDQLRQRMAFAFSQILVASRRDAALDARPRGLGSFYDIFLRNGLGNFRDILREVTFHPIMGRYLSHVGNQKADPSVPRYPDENYAREVMQLFSIGLWELNPNGTRIVVNNEFVPTYSNGEITEFARVFTGLWFPRRDWGVGGYTEFDYSFPMEMHAARHDFEEKILFPDRGLTGRPQITIPARTETVANGVLDIDDAIDALFEHPNTPPFICRALIQFLVTANPSGAYVQRVQDVFVNNGAGVRGDLGAVARAILMDLEARNPQGANLVSRFGLLKEPVLRTTALARAFDLGRHEELVWWNWDTYYNETKQEPLFSPSVFNFFRPDYQAPALIDDDLDSPVFQITDSYSSISVPNLLWYMLTEGFDAGPWNFSLDYTDETVLAHQPEALADRVNLLFCQGTMSAATRTRLIQAVQAIPDDRPGIRVALASYLALCSPEGAIQR